MKIVHEFFLEILLVKKIPQYYLKNRKPYLVPFLALVLQEIIAPTFRSQQVLMQDTGK